MSKIKTGQVVKIDLGAARPPQIIGHEQGNERICLVIKSLPLLKLLVVVPFTSTKPKNPHFYHVAVPKDGISFTMDSYALCHQIRTVSTKRVTREEKMIGTNYFNKIKIVLMDLLDLE